MAIEVIAEIGVNHQNDIDIAERLIIAARDAGANVVKFQASTVGEEVSQRAAPEHYAALKKIVPDLPFLAACRNICRQQGIEFLCTPAGPESLRWVLDLGVKRIKIASDNLLNRPLLTAALDSKLPLIISTGMATTDDIESLFDYETGLLHPIGARAVVTFLHCTSAYPCPVEDANLLALARMRDAFRMPVGWSDHTTSLYLPAVAVGLGAVMIEKHITLDRHAEGPDHRASLEPYQFAQMVYLIHEAEIALGSGRKRLTTSEVASAEVYGKSVVAARAIKAGQSLAWEDIAIKRPGTGIPARDTWKLVGKPATRDYQPDELIE